MDSRHPPARAKAHRAERVLQSASPNSARSLRIRLFDRCEDIAGVLPEGCPSKVFATNVELCRTRSLPTRDRRRLLASPDLAKGTSRSQAITRRGDVQAQLERKVTDYLRKSQALEDYWQRPITGEQLQAEMDRMAKHTKQSEVLRELFEALGNDPFVIAECLARPALSERLLTSWYAYDQRIHGELKQRAEAELQAHSTLSK